MTDILIIDDNDAILHVMSRILQKQGYTTDTAKTGKEALGKINCKFYALAIIDLNLPDMNGISVHRVISARSPSTKKIILTGLPPQRENNPNAEPLDILVKPLSGEELLKAVKEKLSGNTK
jgi:DNA-binding response OmpR family regulator